MATTTTTRNFPALTTTPLEPLLSPSEMMSRLYDDHTRSGRSFKDYVNNLDFSDEGLEIPGGMFGVPSRRSPSSSPSPEPRMVLDYCPPRGTGLGKTSPLDFVRESIEEVPEEWDSEQDAERASSEEVESEEEEDSGDEESEEEEDDGLADDEHSDDTDSDEEQENKTRTPSSPSVTASDSTDLTEFDSDSNSDSELSELDSDDEKFLQKHNLKRPRDSDSDSDSDLSELDSDEEELLLLQKYGVKRPRYDEDEDDGRDCDTHQFKRVCNGEPEYDTDESSDEESASGDEENAPHRLLREPKYCTQRIRGVAYDERNRMGFTY